MNGGLNRKLGDWHIRDSQTPQCGSFDATALPQHEKLSRPMSRTDEQRKAAPSGLRPLLRYEWSSRTSKSIRWLGAVSRAGSNAPVFSRASSSAKCASNADHDAHFAILMTVTPWV